MKSVDEISVSSLSHVSWMAPESYQCQALVHYLLMLLIFNLKTDKTGKTGRGNQQQTMHLSHQTMSEVLILGL